MSTTMVAARLSLAAMAAFISIAGCGGGSDSAVTTAPPPPPPPPTGITTITINSATDPAEPSQNPTFGGTTFGPVGTYQKIVGTATGTLDPADPHNAVIADLQLAQKDANGLVDYSMDFYILAPVDPSKGNHKVFLELPNRGGKQFGRFNGSGGGNNPTTAADAGTAFLMNQGYTLVWAAWEPTASRSSPSMGVTSVVAKNADGSSITGPDYEYIEFDNGTTTSYTTAYNTNSTDTTQATLTVRDHLTDAAVVVPSTGWTWTSTNTIALLPAGTAFKQSSIYELTFTAKDPIVGGVGFAALRDFTSFLRTATADTAGTANPLATAGITRYVAWTLSQPARTMNDFVWLGFNQDLNDKQVFDGVFNWVGAGDGVGLNYRFEQSGRTERNRQNHLYPEAPFPFSYSTLTDPLSGKTNGRDMRCMATSTCPKIMNVISANEYWVKAGSLVHTDLAGNDIPDPPNVRNYLLSGTQHASPAGANSLGACQQFGNSTDQNPALRALWVDLDEWLDGTPPPASAVPQRATGTAVFSATTPNSPLGIGTVSQSSLGWPTIPGVTYTGLITVHNLFDFGPQFDKGILSISPPNATGKVYPSFVSKVDSDGNEIAGIRLPGVAAPVATTAGWNLRSAAFGLNDGCESTGTLIPFAPTVAAKVVGDPRPSLDERYGSHAGYVAAVTAAANNLAAQRLLLPADVQSYVTTAQQPVKVIGNPVYGTYTW
ncbi:MAG: alpha/beta hydrolase domain-containing protein [Caldimonas sp.]